MRCRNNISWWHCNAVTHLPHRCRHTTTSNHLPTVAHWGWGEMSELHRGANCSLTRAMDGRIVRCGIISLCRSAATSEVVKCFQSRVLTHASSAIETTGPLPLSLSRSVAMQQADIPPTLLELTSRRSAAFCIIYRHIISAALFCVATVQRADIPPPQSRAVDTLTLLTARRSPAFCCWHSNTSYNIGSVVLRNSVDSTNVTSSNCRMICGTKCARCCPATVKHSFWINARVDWNSD